MKKSLCVNYCGKRYLIDGIRPFMRGTRYQAFLGRTIEGEHIFLVRSLEFLRRCKKAGVEVVYDAF